MHITGGCGWRIRCKSIPRPRSSCADIKEEAPPRTEGLAQSKEFCLGCVDCCLECDVYLHCCGHDGM